jgi:DnaJ-class molecular chaperone
MSKNHETLGLEPTASSDEITAAYRRLAMQHHPDRGGDAEIFQRVRAAYKALQKTGCPCKGTGFIETREGYFTKRTECPRCWNL